MYQTVACLMNSKHLAIELHAIANGCTLDTAKLSAVFALVFAHPEYENTDVDSVVASLKSKSSVAIAQLGKELHPILCSMNLAVEEIPGGEHWRAERAGPRGNTQRYKALHLSNGVVYAR